MVVVAVLAGLLAIAMRRSRFLSLAAYHKSEVINLGISFSYIGRVPHTGLYPAIRPDGSRLPFEEVLRVYKGNAWHRGLAAKYERAARYPWLPVAPDPLEPE
jgi:hypothetical protein